MAINLHCQVTIQVMQSDVPRDFVVHNVYLQANGTPSSADYQAAAQHVSDVFFSKTGFGGAQPWTVYANRGGTTKVYDLADPKPRPARGTVVYTPTTWGSGSLGPRHLALCLSYYAGRNLPHTRGRVYLGPFPAGYVNEVPASNLLGMVIDLGKGLYSIATMGTASWNHSTHSTVTGLTNTVTNYWANDVWDVQHSRAHVEQTRVRYP